MAKKNTGTNKGSSEKKDKKLLKKEKIISKVKRKKQDVEDTVSNLENEEESVNQVEEEVNSEKENVSLQEDGSENENQRQESVKDHYFTFQLPMDLFTVLYSTLVFKWIQTDRVMIVADNNKLGYHLELYLKHFRMSSVFLDNEMPVNTNRHYCKQFLKGVYNICITSNKFQDDSPNFAKDILENTPIPVTIIYFDTIDKNILDYHCFHQNTKAIYHFISKEKKTDFTQEYEDIDQRITFLEYTFDEDQVSHLRYRCEDIYHSINKSDIKKAKIKKLNQELLHSKNMQNYFKSHPEERKNVIKSIEKNSIKSFKPSASYLPSYLIHEENNNSNNAIANAIKQNYGQQRVNKHQRRKLKGKMDRYLESLEKNDGSAENIKF